MHLPDLRPLRQPDHLRALLARVVPHDSVAPLPARARKPVSRVTQGSLFTLPRGPFSSCRYHSSTRRRHGPLPGSPQPREPHGDPAHPFAAFERRPPRRSATGRPSEKVRAVKSLRRRRTGGIVLGIASAGPEQVDAGGARGAAPASSEDGTRRFSERAIHRRCRALAHGPPAVTARQEFAEDTGQ